MMLYYLPQKYNAEDSRKPIDSNHIEIFLKKCAVEPQLYRENFKKVVVDHVLRDVQTSATVREAYDLYCKLMDRIDERHPE